MSVIDRLFASLMFFTRLPWWRIKNVPSEAFQHTTDFWPMVGLLTGGSMALSLILLTKFLPLSVALLFTILVRILLTGALHEDGFADFCDGMGGGTTRERVLAIMKDSHIGTYGVIGLIAYFSLFFTTLFELATFTSPIYETAAILLFADVYAKSISSFIIVLPYARKEEEAKARVIYHKRNKKETLLHLARILIALALPVAFLFYIEKVLCPLALIVPVFVFLALLRYMHSKIGGYTGDCCGATFILCEISFLLTLLACNI